jgi:uncharacterized protein YbaR (Trm112 family)
MMRHQASHLFPRGEPPVWVDWTKRTVVVAATGAEWHDAGVRRQGGIVMPVDRELLEILACPVDKSPVREEGDRLVCTKCGRRYPVRDGIPVMLVDEAEQPA